MARVGKYAGLPREGYLITHADDRSSQMKRNDMEAEVLDSLPADHFYEVAWGQQMADVADLAQVVKIQDLETFARHH